MGERSRWTDERMDDFLAHINARFDQFDARFAHIDRRFDRIEARLDGMDARFDRLEMRFERLEMRVGRLSWVMAGVLVAQLVALAVMGFVTTQV